MVVTGGKTMPINELWRVMEIQSENMTEQKLVYKYSDWNKNSQDGISKRYFWFSKPTNFNDPFDSNMEILKAFPRSSKVFDKKINDTETLFDYVRKKTDDFGILCFITESQKGSIGDRGYNNLHFWSHYANCHKGISIGFDLESLKEYYSKKILCNASLSKINYLNESADLDKYEFTIRSNVTKRIEGIFGAYRDDKDIDAFFEQILLFKDKRIWGIENEQRIILAGRALERLRDNNPFLDVHFDIFDKNENGYRLPYPEGNSIKEITFGVKFDKKEIDSAIEMISRNNKSVKFYRTELDFVEADIIRTEIK